MKAGLTIPINPPLFTPTSEIQRLQNDKTYYPPLYGISFMLASSLLYTIMNLLIKILFKNSNITVFEIVYIRGFILFFGVYFHSKYKGCKLLSINSKISVLIIMRMIFGFLSNLFSFYQFQILPLSIATMIYQIMPLSTTLIAYFALKEKLTKYDFFGLIISFGGVVLIAYKPGNSNIEYQKISLLVPIIAAIFGSLGDVYSKKLTIEVKNSFSSPFFYAISAMIFSPILFNFNSIYTGHFTVYSLSIVILCILTGIAGWLGLYLLTIAFQCDKAGRIAIIGYSNILFAMIFDIFYFHRLFGIGEIFGGFLILSVNFSIGLMKLYKIID